MVTEQNGMTDFLREVDSQPEFLEKLAGYYSGEGAERMKQWLKLLQSHPAVRFVGMGTSEIVPLLIRSRLEAAGKAVTTVDAGEYIHYGPDDLGDCMLRVLISQSGESAETKKATLELAGREMHTVVVVNDETSTMAQAASMVLPMLAGDEKSISNKTYLNTLGVLYMMAGGKTAELLKVAEAMRTGFDEAAVVRAAEHLLPGGSIHFVARGPALVSANQLALTFMEGAQCHGRAFTGGAFRHGPYEVLGSEHRGVVLAPAGNTHDLCVSMAREMAAAGSHVVLVTDKDGVSEQDNLVVLKVSNPGGEELFPLAFARIQAWLLHHVARLRGYEAGKFSRVSKITDVE